MRSPDEQGATAGRPGRLAGLTILLAEDSWIIAEALAEMLRQQGARVTGPASTVTEARALFQRGGCDLAIFDMNLRGQLATDLILELAEGGTAVIVLSGYSIDPRLQAKVAATLEKPVDEDQLTAAIEACVRARSR